MGKVLNRILITVFAVIFAVSAFMLVRYFTRSAEVAKQYDDIAEAVDHNRQTTEDGEDDGQEKDESDEPVLVKLADGRSVLPEYAEVCQQNTEMIGWIRIEDTKINYPVVQADNDDYYLDHDFSKSYNVYGCPFVAAAADVSEPSDNVIIYGHHMKDGSMFANLDYFKDKDFWKEHRYIYYDTLTERGTYQIIAAFKTAVSTGSSTEFKYYEFIDAENESEFDEYVQKCRELSLYETGVTATYGDKLITLSTCEYSQQNGRMVLVAKKIR